MSLPGRPGTPSTTPTPHRVNPGSMPSTRTRTPLGRVFDTLWDGPGPAASDTHISIKIKIKDMSCLVAWRRPSLPPRSGEGGQSPGGSWAATLALPSDCLAEVVLVVVLRRPGGAPTMGSGGHHGLPDPADGGRDSAGLHRLRGRATRPAAGRGGPADRRRPLGAGTVHAGADRPGRPVALADLDQPPHPPRRRGATPGPPPDGPDEAVARGPDLPGRGERPPRERPAGKNSGTGRRAGGDRAVSTPADPTGRVTGPATGLLPPVN